MAAIKTYATPSILYRYRSFQTAVVNNRRVSKSDIVERELKAIEGGYVYCPRYIDMNDPMEGFYRASRRVAERTDYDDFADQVRAEKLSLGIASFSETWNNELMWAHYADGFRGIAIGYSVRKLLACLDDQHALSRIAYGDKPYVLDLRGMKSEDRARAILSTKNLKWSYEREWRLFAPASGPAVCENAVSHVYIGVRMEEAEKRRVRRRLRAAKIEVRTTLVDGYDIKRWSAPKVTL